METDGSDILKGVLGETKIKVYDLMMKARMLALGIEEVLFKHRGWRLMQEKR